MNSRFTKGDIVLHRRPGRNQWQRGIVVKSEMLHSEEEGYFEIVKVQWDERKSLDQDFADYLIHSSELTAEVQRGHMGK